jgi:hypothetical protein
MKGSLNFVIYLALISALAWIYITLLGFNHFNILHTNTRISVCLKVGAAVVGGVLVAHGYFGRRRLPGSAVKGLVLMAIVMATYWWLGDQAVSIAAQHLSGSAAIYHGNVVSVDRSGGTRAKCRIDIEVKMRPDSNRVKFCLVIKGGKPLGPMQLDPPDAVVIHTRVNSLGEAVESVAYENAVKD